MVEILAVETLAVEPLEILVKPLEILVEPLETLVVGSLETLAVGTLAVEMLALESLAEETLAVETFEKSHDHAYLDSKSFFSIGNRNCFFLALVTIYLSYGLSRHL